MAILLAPRAQDVALLQIKEIAKLNLSGADFKLLEVMSLPAVYTKGADAMGRSQSQYQRRTVSFDVESSNQVVRPVEALALTKAGAVVNPIDFYQPIRKHRGKSRDILMDTLADYLRLRIGKAWTLKPSFPHFISQKGGGNSPNTLQEHMAFLILKNGRA